MRILHIADVHLDRPFVGMALEDAQARRRELREAFDRCLALGTEHGVDAVTIGGDLWEDEHVTEDTIRWVAGRLNRLSLPVVLIAGNHDRLSPGGPYDRAPFEEHVVVLPARDVLAEHRVGDVSFWGVSWRRGIDLTERVLRGVRTPEDGRRHILLLHGTCGAAFDGAAQCQFTGDAVRAAGFDLCLAGHLHAAGTRQDVVVYPGSPEPLNRTEQGQHAVALVEIAAGREPAVEYLDVNRRRYEDEALDLSGVTSSSEVETAVLEAVERRHDLDGLCLTLTLTGRVAVGCEIDRDALTDAVRRRGLATLTLCDTTAPAFDLDALADGTGVTAVFVQRLRERIAAGDDRAQEALELGLRALHGETL